MRIRAFRATVFLAALATLGACNGGAEPDEDPGIVGQYLLYGEAGHPLPFEAPDEQRGGDLTLTADGHAVRRYFFVTEPHGSRVEEIASGTFSVSGLRIHFRLQMQDGRNGLWRPEATIDRGVITLFHIDSSGEVIEEEYVHVGNILFADWMPSAARQNPEPGSVNFVVQSTLHSPSPRSSSHYQP